MKRRQGLKFIKASDNDRSECMKYGFYAIKIIRPCGSIEFDEGSERLNDAITKARRIIQDSEVRRLEVNTSLGVCHYRYDAIDARPVFKIARDLMQ